MYSDKDRLIEIYGGIRISADKNEKSVAVAHEYFFVFP